MAQGSISLKKSLQLLMDLKTRVIMLQTTDSKQRMDDRGEFWAKVTGFTENQAEISGEDGCFSSTTVLLLLLLLLCLLRCC